jgi:hypothetical protein
MPYKDPKIRAAKNAEANKRWYQKNKVKHKAGTAKNRKDYRALWVEFKETQECFICGFDHPAVIDFHHVIRKDKLVVSTLVRNGSYSRAMEEVMTKCIALCANCHRVLHWQERIDAKRTGKMRRKRKKVGKLRHCSHFKAR